MKSKKESRLYLEVATLYADALVNTPKELPYKLKNIADVLREMEAYIPDGVELPMYVLTNERCVNGASALLYPGMLEKMEAFFGGDFVILPSSF